MDFDYPDLESAFMMTPSLVSLNKKEECQTEPILRPVITSAASQGPQTLPNTDRPDKLLSKPTIMFSQETQEKMPRVDRSLKPKSILENSTNNEKKHDGIDYNGTIIKYDMPTFQQESKRVHIAESEAASGQNQLETSSSTALMDYSKDIEAELHELQRIKRQKEEELLNFSKEKEILILEHQARLEKLKSEEKKLSEVQKIKQQQQKDVSDLMKMKMKLQEDIKDENKQIEKSKSNNEKEELTRSK